MVSWAIDFSIIQENFVWCCSCSFNQIHQQLITREVVNSSFPPCKGERWFNKAPLLAVQKENFSYHQSCGTGCQSLGLKAEQQKEKKNFLTKLLNKTFVYVKLYIHIPACLPAPILRLDYYFIFCYVMVQCRYTYLPPTFL